MSQGKKNSYESDYDSFYGHISFELSCQQLPIFTIRTKKKTCHFPYNENVHLLGINKNF